MDNADVMAVALLKQPGAALYVEFKTYEFLKRTLARLVKTVYDGWIAGEFVQTLTNLLTGQIIDAHVKTWAAEGGEGPAPDYLKQSAQAMIADQEQYIEPFYRAIVDARVNQTSLDPLLVRADMWANQYRNAENTARQLIAEQTGGRLVWIYDPVKEHCETCEQLNGLVAFATEWAQAGFRPQNPPNPLLDCGGWQCGCALEQTDKRRSPRVLDTLLNIATARSL